MAEQVKTRFLLLSDTHTHPPHPPTTTTEPYRWPLPSADVAIHTGDLTMTGKIHEHEQAIDLLKKLPADLKIVIPGNHDLTLDTVYYASKGHLHGPRPRYTDDELQFIRSLYTGTEAQAANITYLEEGTRTFQLRNGASLTVYASAYTPELCDWAFAYPRDQDRFNSPDNENAVPVYDGNADIGTNIDVMLTHGPPFGILDEVQDSYSKRQIVHVGCENLLRAVARARPLLHCFGHIHEGWGAVQKSWCDETNFVRSESSQSHHEDSSSLLVDKRKMIDEMGVYVDCTSLKKGRETLFVNSSIMSLRYNPDQSPWVVNLSLDRVDGRVKNIR